MVLLEQLAEAALAGDALNVRQLARDWVRQNPRLDQCVQPECGSHTLIVIAAALVELLAERMSQPAPAWTARVGSLDTPFFLVTAAKTMKRLRHLCETEAPLPLRKRNLFAPPNYLEWA